MSIQTITNAAYNTLRSLDINTNVLDNATYNADRNLWAFEATDEQFMDLCLALRKNNSR